MSLTTKQKVLLPLLIIVLGFLAWQVYLTINVFQNEGIEQSPNLATNHQAQPPQMVNLPTANSNSREIDKIVATNPLAASSQTINLSKDQSHYIQLVHRYQLLQMKKMIAESSQAIAESNLKAAQANAELAKFQMQGPQGNGIGNGNTSFTRIVKPGQITDNAYELVYTGRQAGEWNATLKQGNRLIDVVVGSRMPEGTVVTINGDRVVLRKGNKRIIITFTGESYAPASKPGPGNKRPRKVLQKFTRVPRQPKTTVQGKTQPTTATPEAKSTSTSKNKSLLITKQALNSSTTASINKKAMLPERLTDAKQSLAVIPGLKLSPQYGKDKVSDQQAQNAKSSNKKVNDKNENHAKAAIEANKLTTQKTSITKPLILAKAKQTSAAAKRPIVAAQRTGIKSQTEKPKPLATNQQVKTVAKIIAPKQTEQNKQAIKSSPETMAKKDKSMARHRMKRPRWAHVSGLRVSQQAILAANPRYYTVQLIADKDLKFVKQYQRKHNLTGQSHYYRVYQYGKPLYALISGSYKTVPEAVAAINNLPERMKKWDPFVRRIGIVQDEIRIAEMKKRKIHA